MNIVYAVESAMREMSEIPGNTQKGKKSCGQRFVWIESVPHPRPNNTGVKCTFELCVSVKSYAGVWYSLAFGFYQLTTSKQ